LIANDSLGFLDIQRNPTQLTGIRQYGTGSYGQICGGQIFDRFPTQDLNNSLLSFMPDQVDSTVV
jgi:hypothetical protein